LFEALLSLLVVLLSLLEALLSLLEAFFWSAEVPVLLTRFRSLIGLPSASTELPLVFSLGARDDSTCAWAVAAAKAIRAAHPNCRICMRDLPGGIFSRKMRSPAIRRNSYLAGVRCAFAGLLGPRTAEPPW